MAGGQFFLKSGPQALDKIGFWCIIRIRKSGLASPKTAIPGFFYGDVAQLARGVCLRNKMMWIRVPPSLLADELSKISTQSANLVYNLV